MKGFDVESNLVHRQLLVIWFQFVGCWLESQLILSIDVGCVPVLLTSFLGYVEAASMSVVLRLRLIHVSCSFEDVVVFEVGGSDVVVVPSSVDEVGGIVGATVLGVVGLVSSIAIVVDNIVEDM